jgi:hypothetical protein
MYETLLSAAADHSAETLRGKQTWIKKPRENKRLLGRTHRAMKATYG